MSKVKLSVVLATRNEEANLDRCLSAVRTIADEIVIADEQSTDKTVQIAQRYKAKIISVSHQNNFHINKNVAIDAATGQWILQLDADEVVSPELATEIRSIVENSSPFVGFWVNRKNWFLNRFLTKGGQYPDPTLRLYKRGKGRLPAVDVHEQAKVNGETSRLNNDLLHYRDTSFEKYMQGFNRYSSFIASQMLAQKVKINFANLVKYLFISPLGLFCKLYLRHRGYVDGFPGFIFALFSGLIQPVAYVKYWQEISLPTR